MDKNLPNALHLVDIIYLSQINQAMAMKTETEHYRRLKSVIETTGEGLTMGALYWQLNDVWEAPSWSSIDFQGNWKMLHYFARDFFSNVIVSAVNTADDELSVTVVSDLTHSLSGNITVNVYNWQSFKPNKSKTFEIDMAPNQSKEVLRIPMKDIVGGYNRFPDCFLNFRFTSEPITTIPDNYLFPVPLKLSNFSDTSVTVLEVYKISEDTVELTLGTDRIALFVWLESNDNRTRFEFSKNGFHMLEPTSTVIVRSTELPIGNGKILSSISIRNLKQTYYNTL